MTIFSHISRILKYLGRGHHPPSGSLSLTFSKILIEPVDTIVCSYKVPCKAEQLLAFRTI